jgi:uncharacterized iron-regulated membrane protein
MGGTLIQPGDPMTLRSATFWLHLTVGAVAGAILLILCVTGVALAFEKDLLAWAERGQRQVSPPTPSTIPLSLDDQISRARELRSGVAPTAITVFSDPRLASIAAFGRDEVLFLDPYAGTSLGNGSPALRRFLKWMIEWHRWLGASGDRQWIGKAITGIANLLFLGLVLSGMFLWWPEKWTAARLRSTTVPNLRLGGKARDWNWHHAFGFWSTPLLLVIIVTAVPISYRWAGELIDRALSPPASPRRSSTSTHDPKSGEHTRPIASGPRLSREAGLRSVKEEIPAWEQITFRLAPGGPRRGGTPGGIAPSETNAALSFSVIAKGQRPRFSQQQVTVDPTSGEVLRRETYATQPTTRKVRSWMRFLHTGEALGFVGKAAAAIASLAGALLVWTGFALALRRWFAWRQRRPNTSVE